MILLAAGVWRIESRPQSLVKTLTILLCVCGIVLIAVAAVRNGSNWNLRIAVLGAYSGTGGLLGSIVHNISAKQRAGAILASLGTAATTGFKIISGIAAPAGILSVGMQFIDARKPGTLLMLIGQGLLFATFGLQALLMVRGRWSLADQGIVGPNAFVPWKQISWWDWQDTNTLAIATKPGFRGPRRLKLSVVPEAHEHATAILATRISA